MSSKTPTVLEALPAHATEAPKTEGVPKGYKRTEVGVIPEDWQIVPLSDLLDFRNGVNADKSAYGQGTPFINVLEVITRTHLRGSDIPGRVTLPSSLVSSYSVRRGDILFNRTSETQEEVGFASVYLGDETVVFGGFVIRGRGRGAAIDNIYSGYAFRSPIIRSQIISKGQGAVRANIGQQELSKVLAVLPPLSEQRAIADALSDVDALISSLDTLISKKRAVKTAAMQQLLTGKQRLPGFGGKWEVKRLGEIARITIGRTPSRRVQAYWGRGYPWLSIADLKTKYVTNTKEEITEAAAIGMSVIPKGTLVMSFKLTIGKLAFAAQDLYSNEALCGFNDLDADAEFLYYVLGRTDFSLYGKQAVKGYTVNTESLNAVEIPYPPLKEQTAIAAVLSDMDAEISALEARREKTRQVKQGMMQDLLTGRTRLV